MKFLNMLFGNDDLDPNFGPKIEILNDFYEIWHQQQMEYCNRYSLPGLKLKSLCLLFIKLEIETAFKSCKTV